MCIFVFCFAAVTTQLTEKTIFSIHAFFTWSRQLWKCLQLFFIFPSMNFVHILIKWSGPIQSKLQFCIKITIIVTLS